MTKLEITLPNKDLADKVAKEKQFLFKEQLFKDGSEVNINIFETTIKVKLFFDNEKKMLMFIDPVTKGCFNFLGYVSNSELLF